MLVLICSMFIGLKNPDGTMTHTQVEIPVRLIETSDLRFKIDASEAVTRFPNRDNEVDYSKLLLSRDLCRRS